MFYEVIPTKIFNAKGAETLTYTSGLNLSPGHIVEIPFGKRSIPGIVYKKVKKPDFKTREITRLLYEQPLPPHILKSIFWLSSYYLSPLPQVANLFLPVGILKNRRKPKSQTQKTNQLTPKIALNPAQKQALEATRSVSTATCLLHGITGSGKTNIYLERALECLKEGKSVILLVPEISLTPQLVGIFEAAFGQNITLIHSRQTEATRHLIWEKILQSETPQVIIGPRSALLSPVKNLGLIIIDEAHESSYFQENPPRYSALRLASFIANSEKISCLTGTATPLIADYYLAKHNNSVVSLTEKAKSTATPPEIHLIDLKDQPEFSKNRYFSNSLLSAISRNLENHHQTLIFHNRRGSSSLTICESCGWQSLCPTCFLPLTLHTDSYRLICHTCGYQAKVPLSCPNCHHPDIVHKGFGTKLLESELKKLFPDAKIARFDADNDRHTSLDHLYSEVKSGNFDIIIGTQTIAKGLDLPLLATVGIAQADSGLALPDFASEERTFHLLTQVIGRVGRGHLSTAEVFLQTYQPEHPVITSAINGDYLAFYNYLIKNRKKSALPPFSYLARLNLTYKTESIVLKHINNYYNILKNLPHISVSVPMPAFHEQSTKGYTWQLVIKSTSRNHLLSALKSLPPNPHFSIYIDPPSLL